VVTRAAAEEAWPDLDADLGVMDEDEEDVSPPENPENDLPVDELQALYTAAAAIE